MKNEMQGAFILVQLLDFSSNFIVSHGWICLGIGMVGFGAEGIFLLGLGYNYQGEPL